MPVNPDQTRIASSAAAGHNWSDDKIIRLGVVVVALLVLFVRMPTNFTTPQFWGEDAPFFYQQALDNGWRSLDLPAAGYFTVLQRLIAIVSTYFPPAFAPTIMNYGAFALTLFIVWLATSPRFDIPFKQLNALAIVVVPMGFEVLGTAANTQWIAPIGVFILLFLRPHGSRLVLLCEVAFVAVIAFTGPCAIFLTPLAAVLTLLETNRQARTRLLLLTAALSLGFLVIGGYVFVHRQEALNPPGIPVMQSSSDLWITLPLAKLSGIFGPATTSLFSKTAGLFPAIIVILLAGAFALRRPHRTLKLSMLFLGVTVMLSGMIKYRVSLPFLADGGSTRYFYAASVFSLWFICCAAGSRTARAVCVSVVALAELFCVFNTWNTPRNSIDFEWPVWASFISSGLPLTIPTTPASWYISEPAGDGTLSKFNAWIGSPLASRLSKRGTDGCTGSLDTVVPFKGINDTGALWMMKGRARDTTLNKPFQLIALVDAQDRILGYGLPGFRNTDGTQPGGSGWIGIFATPEPSSVTAYGIAADGQSACPIGKLVPPLRPANLTNGIFAGGIRLSAGTKVVQRFKPAYPAIKMITVAVVAWALEPTSYKIDWRITALSNTNKHQIGSGEILTQGLKDWQILQLPTPVIPDFQPDEIEVEFSVNGDEPTSTPIGLPIFRPLQIENLAPVQVGESSAPNGEVIGLTIHYSR
jgi:hypothetical protein